ncbi:tyrosine-type recombinase/integrase [Actimicrobium sp. CCI2.3]|uniref:tyrosine-type recombinase/integrase n=1 Tax=Actimicrobium sp. CCI2.3 TaxID=3048616 RepID=UPI002AB4075C|nr:integrase arm-type DNA-binding domain-containing protein [Actimicrobium sp. CCI2.3]MDY7576006.1 integrase arm-type DNA-binding domain-containing protein [Actimicrobium sp. CCI2.3]MEB0023319.1 integrase arm-type DNA-binding domain-containing protein [Actimicrobium sp. CCI2.3]
MALTDIKVKSLKHGGAKAGDKHADGQALYLLVSATGKYWRMNYRFDGKQKTLALGTYPAVSLLKARKLRDDAQELLASKVDPGQAKREDKQARADAAEKTFAYVAQAWLAKTESARAASTHIKLSAWITKDVIPYIGSRPISTLKAPDVLLMLQKIEARGAVSSAHQIKQLCGRIFRFAAGTGWVERDVTTDLKGALSAAVEVNRAAITDPHELGGLLRAIHNYTGHPYAVAALKLSPLVFLRPGELRSAEWTEINLDTAEWTIPAEKMKMKKDHLIPLSAQSLEVLRTMKAMTGQGKYVFPSIRTFDRCMSENTINAALRSMGYSKETMTAHGFRATARTIMDEVMGERPDLIEHQLAHAVKDANGRAYNRTAHLPARRDMMQRWADYLDKLRAGADVIQLRGGTA